MAYYEEKLSGSRLKECYDIAPPRVKQYLAAEIRFVVERLEPGDAVLELGCGYGRVTQELAQRAGRTVGIDTSVESLTLAAELAGAGSTCEFIEMDALDLGFSSDEFDAVVCVQNGICAFGVDQELLLSEALRVAGPGGLLLFSTYSDHFWKDRLEWFEAQAAAGLIGPIDYAASGNGVIACRDGFRAGRLTRVDWESLCSRIGVVPEIIEVDGSSVFCELLKQ